MKWIEKLRQNDQVIVQTAGSFRVKLTTVERITWSREKETGNKETMIILKGGAKFGINGRGRGMYRNKWLEQVKIQGE